MLSTAGTQGARLVALSVVQQKEDLAVVDFVVVVVVYSGNTKSNACLSVVQQEDDLSIGCCLQWQSNEEQHLLLCLMSNKRAGLYLSDPLSSDTQNNAGMLVCLLSNSKTTCLSLVLHSGNPTKGNACRFVCFPTVGRFVAVFVAVQSGSTTLQQHLLLLSCSTVRQLDLAVVFFFFHSDTTSNAETSCQLSNSHRMQGLYLIVASTTNITQGIKK